MAMSRPIQHNAPAGQMYSSIREAGEKTLETYCQRFPQSPDRESFILPILFKSDHPENVDQSDPSLSESDQKLLTGLNINIRGERGEYEVYKMFYTIVRQSPTESILVLHGYKLDNDNGRNLKKHAIISELPAINLSCVNMKKEHDFIVIVQSTGIVLCEVKTSASAKNLASAEEQLHNSETFVQQILTAIAGPTYPKLPIIKVIVVPHETSSPSAPTKHGDCHVIYQDDLQNFTPKWAEMVNELNTIAQTCHIPPNHFEHLVQFLVGVWSMKPITKNTYTFDDDNATLAIGITTVDSSVHRAEFAPSKQAQKLTNDVATSANEIFQRVDDFNMMYLSPQQKEVYDNYKHALIHAHAGTGKTMLIIFKIIELLENDPRQKVLLVAPRPHHIRLQQILNKHSITTDIVTNFPYTKQTIWASESPPLLPTCDVLIIALENFFSVPRKLLMQFDVSKFNVFFDDLHSYLVSEDFRLNVRDICTFSDIGDFIDNSYNLLSTTEQYAWFAFDVVQQGEQYRDYRDSRRSDRLFLTSNGIPRTFTIPVVTMKNVLRSTKEITDVVDLARQEQMKSNQYDTKYVIKDIASGHHITTGTRVLYEKLKGADKKHQILFVCDRVCALLRSLTSTTSPQRNPWSVFRFPFSTVAILLHNNLHNFKPHLQSMIRKQFSVGVMSIEQQLLNRKANNVIIDSTLNAQSFESPTVVCVRSASFDPDDPDEQVSRNKSVEAPSIFYNMLSRARTQCLVVDVSTDPLPLQHIDVVMWEEVNGTFQKI